MGSVYTARCVEAEQHTGDERKMKRKTEQTQTQSKQKPREDRQWVVLNATPAGRNATARSERVCGWALNLAEKLQRCTGSPRILTNGMVVDNWLVEQINTLHKVTAETSSKRNRTLSRDEHVPYRYVKLFDNKMEQRQYFSCSLF